MSTSLSDALSFPFHEDFRKVLEKDDATILQAYLIAPCIGVCYLEMLKLDIKPLPQTCIAFLTDQVAREFPAFASEGLFLFAGNRPWFYIEQAIQAQKRYHAHEVEGCHLLLRMVLERWHEELCQASLPMLASLFTLKEVIKAFPQSTFPDTSPEAGLARLVLHHQASHALETLLSSSPLYTLAQEELVVRFQKNLQTSLPSQPTVFEKKRL